METFSFDTFSAFELEKLSRDLLQKHIQPLNIRFETFGEGRDGGIDFRAILDNNVLWIGQCKKYSGSFAALLNKLRKDEVAKVARLAPARYFFVTSLPLNPDRKKKIENLFAPYIKDQSDIYGCSDLNDLIRDHPEVKEQFPKLWLTDPTIIKRAIASSVFARHLIDEGELEHVARTYVHNDSYIEAKRILDSQHCCVITGDPGIGKSTLAQILVLNAIREGLDAFQLDFQDLDGELKRFEPIEKRIYYFDDFLGETRFDPNALNYSSSKLLRFIEKVRKSPSARFILTTRTYILNQANLQFEKLAHTILPTCTIDVTHYTTDTVRYRIYENHLELSEDRLPQNYIDELYDPRVRDSIIAHRNFNPRIISYIASSQFIKDRNPSQYARWCIESLSNPIRIWDFAFKNHLSQNAQYLLLVLDTLPVPVTKENLEKAFNAYLRQIDADFALLTFQRSLAELENAFIRVQVDGASSKIAFQNPSVADYLEHLLYSQSSWISPLIGAAVFPEQIKKCAFRYLYWEEIPFEENISKGLANLCATRLCAIRLNFIHTDLVFETNPTMDAFYDLLLFHDNVEQFEELQYEQLTSYYADFADSQWEKITFSDLEGALHCLVPDFGKANTESAQPHKYEALLREVFLKKIESFQPVSVYDFDALDDLFECVDHGHWVENYIVKKYSDFFDYLVWVFRDAINNNDLNQSLLDDLVFALERARFFGIDIAAYGDLLVYLETQFGIVRSDYQNIRRLQEKAILKNN